MSDTRWQPPVRFPQPKSKDSGTSDPSPVRLPVDEDEAVAASTAVAAPTKLPSKGDRWRRFAWKLFGWSFALLVLSLGGVELYRFMLEQLIRNPMLGWFYLGLIGTMLLALLILAAREARDYLELRALTQLREEGGKLLAAPGFGQARKYCEHLQSRLHHHPVAVQGHQRFTARVKDFHNDVEVLTLYQEDVLAPLDASCHRLIEQQALKAALFAAVSPFALLDAGLMLWRGVRLIKLVARHYGGRPGTRGTYKLARAVLHSLLFAGGSELVSDAVTGALGHTLLSTLSGRAAQGLANGLLLTRIGLMAMSLCRPMPLTEGQGSSLKRIGYALFRTLKGGSSTDPDEKP